MKLNTSRFVTLSSIPFLVFASFLSSSAQAASISYPTQGPVPPGVTFTDIVESSGTDPVPLFGSPTAFPVGLDFDPTSFVASVTNGGADITDGQLNFTIGGDVDLPNLVGIDVISLFEAGDYTLVGVGTPATQVLAGAILRATVTQIDGVNVAPIALSPVNASVGFNLVANPGVVQPWSLGLSLDVAAQLANLGFDSGQSATMVEVMIDNSLVALGELSSASFIAKKEFFVTIGADPSNSAPEPTSFALLSFAAIGLLRFSRRRLSI